MNNKKQTNIFLILTIVTSAILMIININSDSKVENSNEKPSKGSTPPIIYSNSESNDTILSEKEYSENIKYTNDLFSSILKKYGLDSITVDSKSENITASETSILLKELDIPNGYKTIITNPQNNEHILLYISLTNILDKSNTWSQTLNLSISSNGNIPEFNNINYPEIYELLQSFKFETNELSIDINNVFTNKNQNITKSKYTISRDNSLNPNFTQISIYLNSGSIKND